MEIIPSILAKSYDEFESIIRKIEPYVERVHIDVADGKLVSNTTVKGFEELNKVNTNLKIGAHLMVDDPANWLKDWYNTNADRIIFHAEAGGDFKNIIDDIHKNKRKAGIALNPDTSVDKIESLVSDLDFIQFMTVHPGFYGAEFVEEVVKKIDDFHRQHPDTPIIVDGGVNLETAPGLVKAGASMLVVGSYIFKSNDIGKAIENLKRVSRI